jgi:hypothetical protein
MTNLFISKVQILKRNYFRFNKGEMPNLNASNWDHESVALDLLRNHASILSQTD